MKIDFNGVYSNIIYLKRNGIYIINLFEYRSLGTHCVAAYPDGDNVNHIDSFAA